MLRFRWSVVTLSCLVFVTFPDIAQTFAPGGNNVVRDSTGQVVGQYDGSTSHLVSTVINGLPVYLDVERNKLTIHSSLFYDQPNCQGTTFLGDDIYGPTTPAAVAADGTIYVAASRPATSRVIASFYDEPAGQCRNATLAVPTDPAQVGPNIKTRFTPPFTIGPGVLPAAIVEVPANGRLLLGSIFATVMIIALLRLRG